MAHLETNIGGVSVVGFYGRPVLNRIGSFDDRGNPGETFLGGWVSASIPKTSSKVSLFLFARDRKTAVYEQGAAADQRRTIGLRYFGGNPTVDYTFQAAYQYGDFGTAQIEASGVAGDVGWHPALWGRPRIALSFGVASGDRLPNDKTLGTFDVLYPNQLTRAAFCLRGAFVHRISGREDRRAQLNSADAQSGSLQLHLT